MRLVDLVEGEDTVDGYGGAAGRDVVEEVLQHLGGQVAGVTSVRGEPHPLRQVVDGVEVLHRPLPAHHPGEAHGAMDLGGPEGVGECRGPDELDRRVHALREDVTNLVRDRPRVDEDVVDAEPGSVWSRGR